MKNICDLNLFKNTVSHQNSGTYLYYANFSDDLDRRIRERFGISRDIKLSSYFGFFEPEAVSMKQPDNDECHDFSKYYKDITIPEKAFINRTGVLYLPGSMYHFTRCVSPLRNAVDFNDIINYPYPDYSAYSDTGMKEAVDAAHISGKVVSCCIGHMYEEAWQIRGYERFLEDMALNPEWCEYILEKLMNRNLIMAKAAAKAGVDYIITGDDVANQKTLMFSLEMWRRMIKKRWAVVYEAARSIKPDIQIWYHSDGNIEKIIPELIEIGVTILNPLQPECMDIIKLKKNFGNAITFDGTIGTQTVMPFGTPDDVKRTISENMRNVGNDGALILSPTHLLEPEVPIDNVLAFVEAASFGRIL